MRTIVKGSLDSFRKTMRTSAYSETDPEEKDDKDPLSMMVIMLDRKKDDGSPAYTEREAMLAASSAMLELFAGLDDLEPKYRKLMKRWVNTRIRKLVKHANRNKFDKSIEVLKREHIPFVIGKYSDAEAIVVNPLHASVERSTRLKPIGSLQLHGYHTRGDAEACEDTKKKGLHVTVDTSLGMSDGKMVAQFLHAVQVSVCSLDDEHYAAWSDTGYAVVPPVLGAPLDSDDIVIHDAGFTEIPPDSFTASARLSLSLDCSH